MSDRNPRIAPPAHVLHLADASPAWGLVMQSGVGIACTVNVSLTTLLHAGFGLTADQTARLDVALLDGQPVDDRDAALTPDGARLALAAGLPGIAGLAMKSGSAVRALRGGITHRAATVAGHSASPCPGQINLALFSLALPMLARHFLTRGVLAAPEQIIRYAALAPDDACVLDGRGIPAAALAADLAHLPTDTVIRLTALLRS